MRGRSFGLDSIACATAAAPQDDKARLQHIDIRERVSATARTRAYGSRATDAALHALSS